MMQATRVVQATAWYPPHGVGGTEVYVESLVSELQALGVGSKVLVPRKPEAAEFYEREGTPVSTYPVNELPARGELRQRLPHKGFDRFRALLAGEKGAIYHQHSWTRGCGLHHLLCARELGLRTVLTVHVASNICLRGTMMRFGETPCDGVVDEAKCGACYIEGRGLSKTIARTLAGLPRTIAQRARQRDGRIATALSARVLGCEKHQQLRTMIDKADLIIAVCQWLYDALVENGAPPEKLRLIRQGLPSSLMDTASAREEASDAAGKGPLRLLFLGRWDSSKGVDVLVKAVRALPSHCEVTLSVHALAANAEERAYEARVRMLAGGDRRIAFVGPLARSALASTMAQHDVLAVPSICLETGPLVVLEAQAAGLFVLGSRLGGIAELIEEGGELVESGKPDAWAESIERLSRLHAMGGFSKKPTAIRTMKAVGLEMAHLYRSL
jgi:glycosyltransferase involved in cell wall biosynthesis